MSERKETARKDARTAGKTALNETNQRNNEAVATALEHLAAALEHLAAAIEQHAAIWRKIPGAIETAIRKIAEKSVTDIDAAIKKVLSDPEVEAAIKKAAETRKTNGKKQGGAA